MFLIAYAMNEWVAPASVDLSTRTFYQIIYHTDALPVEPQFFRKDPDTGNTFYVAQVAPDNKTMMDVQIFKPAKYGPWNETLQAKTASVQGSSLVLHDVIDTRYNNDGFLTNQQHVKSVSIGLPLGETASQFVSQVNNDPWTMSSKSLRTQVNALQSQGIGGTAMGNLQINLADKLAWPFACFIGVLVALPLALRFGKRGRTLGIALAIIAFFVYYLMVSAASAFGRNGALNPFVAAWLPNVIMGTAGTVLFGWKSADVCASHLQRVVHRHARVAARMLRRRTCRPAAHASDEQRRSKFALTLFNTQSCAQHYTDDDARASWRRPRAEPRADDNPGPPVRRPGPPNMPPAAAATAPYTVNPTPHPLPGTYAGRDAAAGSRRDAAARPSSTEPVFLVRGGETPPPIPPAGQATPRRRPSRPARRRSRPDTSP